MESNTNESSRLRPRSNSYHQHTIESSSSSSSSASIGIVVPSSSSSFSSGTNQNESFVNDSNRGLDTSFNAGPLRKGKWTTEEENYANKIIELFNKGLLQIPIGTTLRSYLSEKLNWYVYMYHIYIYMYHIYIYMYHIYIYTLD